MLLYLGEKITEIQDMKILKEFTCSWIQKSTVIGQIIFHLNFSIKFNLDNISAMCHLLKKVFICITSSSKKKCYETLNGDYILITLLILLFMITVIKMGRLLLDQDRSTTAPHIKINYVTFI